MVSFHLSLSSLCLQHFVTKTLPSLQPPEKHNLALCFLMFCSVKCFVFLLFCSACKQCLHTLRENQNMTTAEILLQPGGMGVLGCVATGLAGTGVLGSEETLSVSFFSSIPMGIRSGELSFPFTCSNSCT